MAAARLIAFEEKLIMINHLIVLIKLEYDIKVLISERFELLIPNRSQQDSYFTVPCYVSLLCRIGLILRADEF